MEHPRPWWFECALRVCPDRCREIPEAVNPSRIVLRQVALWKRHIYLQQFAGSEDIGWMHSHQWRFTIALGLWGSYVERRLGGRYRRVRRAPYAYAMGRDVVHQVLFPSAGHTSIFVGLWRDDSLKEYHRTGNARPWEKHIQVMVARI